MWCGSGHTLQIRTDLLPPLEVVKKKARARGCEQVNGSGRAPLCAFPLSSFPCSLLNTPVPAPLSGITVIEAANYVAAPAAGALLADLGANVIKIEPPGGEVMRGVVPTGGTGNLPFNFLFELENRGKKSVTIAMDAPGGPELLLRLLRDADVFLTNFMAPRLEKFGLTPEAALAANPRLVYVSVTGYGISDPDADRPGFDFSAFWTRSGLMSLVGHPGSPPVLSRIAQGDHTTGINAVAATLAALRLRDLTGEGQVVEVSLQQTGAYTIATDLSRAVKKRATEGDGPHRPRQPAVQHLPHA